MSKRRVKQLNISVIGLFKLAGRHKKMDEVFVYQECQSTTKINSAKNKKHTNSITNNACHVSFTLLFFFLCAFPIRFV